MPDIRVLDSKMHYEDSGRGAPIVLLHGNPTSSFLWRTVIPQLDTHRRCLAPDLIGMGRSGKPDVTYRFADHARYLEAWMDALDLREVTLVGHDWGGALAFDWAVRHPERVAGIAFMETIVRPLTSADLSAEVRELFAALRRPGEGEAMIFEANAFIEAVLPASVLRPLTTPDHDAYRAPFAEPASRTPMLVWPREIPIDGQPADVAARVQAYSSWLTTSEQTPKLLLTFEPGAVMTADLVDWSRDHIASLEVHHVGPGLHFVQEDQGTAIGAAINRWLDQLHTNRSSHVAAAGTARAQRRRLRGRVSPRRDG